MAVRIKSTIPLIYSSRNQASGIIVIDITEWKYDVIGARYTAVVTDYVSEMVDVSVEGETQSIEQLTKISTKNVYYAKADIDGLYFYLNNPIELTESYSEEMDSLITLALLYTTQTDPIYGSTAQQWEIVT